ncbi:FAD-dependent oxidoreductase [Agromyces aerolatus]|uniref:FAD-dependent oxidoreductase n=1 Tax=Agromyces sp. LY-1074 TaxID=3074080 RepID=UPI0028576550|nr:MULTISPECIES: FAD-dependent oxidoreductase [unclassified Agromyces]MDR5699437.1 FAD-dependent oxidoreductase [Agromyces sp. LY-1074]MDR5705733.1 FAD-dependent oxidoreductase [Agromyces sp. LY-1358]
MPAVAHEPFDEETDVIVVGSGAGGLSAAAIAAEGGASVIVLEKAGIIGGTTRKSAAALWIPGNRYLRDAGIEDRAEDVIRFLARLGRPALYDPEAPRFGLPEWEYEMLAAFCAHAPTAQDELERIGAMWLAPSPFGISDYQGHRAENLHPVGRTLYEAQTLGAADGGQVLVDRLAAGARRHGAEIRVEHEVRAVVEDDERAVVGVVVEGPSGVRRIRARAGVIFASGGFTHNPEYRLQFLNGPFMGGCAAPTNTGDFLRIGLDLGVQLGDLSEAWTVAINTERMEREPDTFMSSFYVLGDGMVQVNRAGKRAVNEKAPYNEHGRVMSDWDPVKLRYPNMPLIAIWDEHVAARWGIDRFGNPVPAPGADPYWVVSGDSLDALAAAIDGKLAELGGRVGHARLDEDFVGNLQVTLDRYGDFADAGVDEDFGRGDTEFERYVSARFGDGDGPNPLMRRLATSGRLYAAVLALGTLDTKGGPRTTPQREVLRTDGRVVPGLYAVGNCAASATGQGYPGAGATLGPIVTEGYLAATQVLARVGRVGVDA